MWTALYTDGDKLLQFDAEGNERLFSGIDQGRLHKFIVSTPYKEIIVNIKDGLIKVNGIKFDFGFGEDKDYRLIYFRRVRRTLGNDVPNIKEHVGWQTTVQGSQGSVNVKRIFGIEPDKVTIQCD